MVTRAATLSRRDVLAAFLGAPVALEACRRPRRAEYGGEIVGGAADLGHHLRAPPEALARALAAAGRAGAPVERTGVVVVGAGPAGLSAAWRLVRAGVRDVVVLDLEPVAGGTSRAGRNGVGGYPWGAHYVPVPMPDNRALVTLLDEMGLLEGRDAQGRPLVAEQYLVRDPDERVFRDGAWHEGLYLREGASDEDLAELRRFQSEIDRWVAFRDARGRRAFGLPAAAACSDASEPAALDRVTMAEWMDAAGLRSERLRWLVDYACRDDYGLRAREASAWAGLFYFASRQERPGAPAAELIAFPEGNGRFVAHLAAVVERATGAPVRTGQLVLDVDVREGGGVAVTAFDAAWRAARVIHADRAIVAVPRFLAGRVVAPLRRAPPAYLGAFTYAPWMVANVTLRDRPRYEGAEPAWDNVLYDSPSVGYVSATHQALRDHGPTVLTYYFPLAGRDVRAERARLLSAGWAEWADVVVTDLARAHPRIESLVERVDVYRWGHAMVRPVPGLMWGGARAAAAAPIDERIFFAHTDLSGLALFEEAQYHGIRAAEAVLAARGDPPGGSLIG